MKDEVNTLQTAVAKVHAPVHARNGKTRAVEDDQTEWAKQEQQVSRVPPDSTIASGSCLSARGHLDLAVLSPHPMWMLGHLFDLNPPHVGSIALLSHLKDGWKMATCRQGVSHSFSWRPTGA